MCREPTKQANVMDAAAGLTPMSCGCTRCTFHCRRFSRVEFTTVCSPESQDELPGIFKGTSRHKFSVCKTWQNSLLSPHARDLQTVFQGDHANKSKPHQMLLLRPGRRAATGQSTTSAKRHVRNELNVQIVLLQVNYITVLNLVVAGASLFQPALHGFPESTST